MKSAVCVLVPSADAKTFLSVSRRNDTTRWGLPGGKVDAGESNFQAVIREVLEESGIQLLAEFLEPLFSARVPRTRSGRHLLGDHLPLEGPGQCADEPCAGRRPDLVLAVCGRSQ